MARYQAGEAAAFDALFKALSPRIHRWLLHATGNRATADDLMQETFLSIHRARATWRPGAPVTPWAFAIARHAMVSRFRSEGRRARRGGGRADLSRPAPPAPGGAPPRPPAGAVLQAPQAPPPPPRQAGEAPQG